MAFADGRLVAPRGAWKTHRVDTTRTLNELDPPDWGRVPADASGLIRACHAARQKPLNALTAEDLRVLIGQNMNLSLLVPLAIRRLRENPLSEGDFYPGDLLNAVVTADPEFWADNDALADEVDTILDDLEFAMERLREPAAAFRVARRAKYT